jgi:hypothetical protein
MRDPANLPGIRRRPELRGPLLSGDRSARTEPVQGLTDSGPPAKVWAGSHVLWLDQAGQPIRSSLLP